MNFSNVSSQDAQGPARTGDTADASTRTAPACGCCDCGNCQCVECKCCACGDCRCGT